MRFLVRRISILVTTILLALSGVGLSPANAAGEYDGTDGLVACVSDGGVTGAGSFRMVANEVTESTDCAGAVVIPDGVTSIRWGAFFGNVTTVSIPKTVTSIEAYAFNYAATITAFSVDSLNPNYSAIDGVLFDKTGTSLVSYPAGKLATTYAIPSGVTAVTDYSFAEAATLTAVDIPASVTTISTNAFPWTAVLDSYQVDSQNPSFSSSNGILFNKDKTTLVSYPGAKSGSQYSVPSGVTAIGIQAFANAKALTTLTITEGVTSIGWGAFQGAMALTSLSIPSTVTAIGDYAFDNASALRTLTVSPLNSNFISKDSVMFSKDMTSVLAYPSALTSKTYSIPTGVTSIARGAFQNATHLTSITIPSSVTSIGDSAFYGANSIVNIILPNGVQTIGSNAFGGTSALTSITLPDTLTTIGDGAFYNSPAITSITIPANVTSIGVYAFFGTTALNNVYFLGSTAPEIGDSAFGSLPVGSQVHLKDGASGFDAVSAAFNGVAPSSGVHTVTYNSNGGTAVSGGVFAFGGPIATTPVSPKRADYAFVGWSLQINGATVAFPYTPSTASDITLYAKWKIDAAHTLTVKRTYTAKTLAKQVGVKVISKKALVSIKVSSASKKVCVYTGSKLKTLKAGSCIVTFKVQEPQLKKGKKPVVTNTLKTFAVTSGK